MSYTKHNYKKGDELLASQLNDMDDQIALNEQTADTLVTVSNTQPAATKNRVWVKATPSEIEIPTMEDHNELSRQLSDVESALKSNVVQNGLVYSEGHKGLVYSEGHKGFLTSNGTYSNTAAFHSVTTEKIPCSEGDVFFYSGKSGNLAVAALLYNGDTISSSLVYSGEVSNQKVVIPSGVNYIVFTSYAANGTDVTLKVGTIPETVQNELDAIMEFNGLFIAEEHNGFLTANGTYSNPSSFHSLTTRKHPCKAGDTYLYSGKSANLAVGCLFYNGSSIASAKVFTGSVYNQIVEIPSGVTDVVFTSYAANGTDVVLSVGKVGQNPVTDSKLYKKKINFLGDSYVANNGQPVANTWEYKLAEKYSMTYRNYGINGNCLVLNDNGMWKRYTEMDNDADYIVVIGGTNDFNAQADLTLFRERLDGFIENLVAKYPNGIIVFFTIWNSLDQAQPASAQTKTYEKKQYNDIIVDECKKYGIHVFDSWTNSGMRAWDEAFRTAYFQASTDRSHLNADGHNRFLPIADSFMQTIG